MKILLYIILYFFSVLIFGKIWENFTKEINLYEEDINEKENDFLDDNFDYKN